MFWYETFILEGNESTYKVSTNPKAMWPRDNVATGVTFEAGRYFFMSELHVSPPPTFSRYLGDAIGSMGLGWGILLALVRHPGGPGLLTCGSLNGESRL